MKNVSAVKFLEPSELKEEIRSTEYKIYEKMKPNYRTPSNSIPFWPLKDALKRILY